jgi:Rrf2 family protein
LTAALASLDVPRRAVDLAQHTGASPARIRDVLQALSRAGLVGSRPGAAGGYWLARAPECLSLLELVEAMEGPMTVSVCALTDLPCPFTDLCELHAVWLEAQASVEAVLRTTSLADIIACR